MAAPGVTDDSTTQEINRLGNVCLVCGFPFVNKYVDADGNIKIHKCLDKKLRLSTDRIKTLKNVCGFSDSAVYSNDTGVCQKCFRSAEKVLKLEKEAVTTRESVKATFQLTLQRFNIGVPPPSERFIKKQEIKKEGVDVKRVLPEDPQLVPVKLIQIQEPNVANVITNRQPASTNANKDTEKAQKSLGGDIFNQAITIQRDELFSTLSCMPGVQIRALICSQTPSSSERSPQQPQTEIMTCDSLPAQKLHSQSSAVQPKSTLLSDPRSTLLSDPKSSLLSDPKSTLLSDPKSTLLSDPKTDVGLSHGTLLDGDAACAWKRLVGRFYWLNDSEIAKHLIEVHDQWCGDQCSLEKTCDKEKSGSERSCDKEKSGSERSCDKEKSGSERSCVKEKSGSERSCDKEKSGSEKSCGRPDEIPGTQSSGGNKDISLQMEVDEGAESVNDDSSNDGFQDPASEEEGDIKQEPNVMDYTPQNTESTYQKGDDLLPLLTNKWTNSGGDTITQAIPVVIQEPTDRGEYENSVIQSVETSHHHTQLTSSGATSHPVMSDTNIGVVKQEPTDRGEYENSVIQSVEPTQTKTISHHHSPLTSGAPTSLSVMSTNIVTSVKPSVTQGIPSTKAITLNPLGMGPRSLFPIIPGVNVAQTPCPAAPNPAVVGSQTVLPIAPRITQTLAPRITQTLAPGTAQTLNLATSGNVIHPQLLNVVKRGNSLFVENSGVPSSTVTPSLQNPPFTFAHPVGITLQSASSLPPTIPMSANFLSNVGQGGSVALQPMLVPVSGVDLLSGGHQVSTSSTSLSGAGGEQTDGGCKQMDEKNEKKLENSQTAGEVSPNMGSVKRRLSENDEGPSTSKRFVGETVVEEGQLKNPNVNISNPRFKTITEEELEVMKSGRHSKGTKHKTKWGVKIFQDISESKRRARPKNYCCFRCRKRVDPRYRYKVSEKQRPVLMTLTGRTPSDFDCVCNKCRKFCYHYLKGGLKIEDMTAAAVSTSSSSISSYSSLETPQFVVLLGFPVPYATDSWANTDPCTHQRWDQVPRRSKHPLLTGQTRRETYILIR
ncbi:uncharacterized protein LOC125663311 isoform X4 [Ostrea edulis]|uniref:uncharacterized protein LOC125663311 isoform X4 n=1 Tax=Ostrea edulis TaxID=37623 RepID=UPI0024AE9861|nr:uncharacterized protein LOC125663311 isoform X4 [Ostrea edulis]